MRHLCPGKAKSCGSLIKFNSCAKLFSRASRAVGAHAGPVSLDLFGGVTPERGFLPAHDPPPRLTLAGAEAWEAALDEIPKLSIAGKVRSSLQQLPAFPLEALLPGLDPACLPSPAAAAVAAPEAAAAALAQAAPSGGTDAVPAMDELWRAYLLLSFLAHAYMWCDRPDTPQVLPSVLAAPWAAVSHALDMPPVLVYATYNLLNWRRLDPKGPVALGNIVCLNNFLGTLPDEEWFRLVHVAIEARAVPALAALQPMQLAAEQADWQRVEQGLAAMHESLQDMQAILARMGEKCDPGIYYQRVRLPMSGWRGNPALPQGLLYEGVWREPVQLYGETGAQSGILAAFDAALGVQHEAGWLRDYLDTMQLHMPPTHRTFIAQLASRGTPVRAAAAAGAPAALQEAYNEVVADMQAFRTQHRAFASSYIAKFSAKEKGTGGSDFMPALGAYRDTTAAHRLPT